MTNKTAPEKLKEQYQARFSKIEPYRDGLWKILTKNFFQRYINESDRVLDLGAGWGEFINNINAKEKIALDLNPDTKDKLKNNIEFVSQDCTEPWPEPIKGLDVIFSSNFLEHLPDKSAIEKSLSQAWNALKPGGKIILVGPNIKYVPGAYWDFWDHHVAISDNSICEALVLSGFEIQHQKGKFLPYTMSNGITPPLFFVAVYLKLPFLWNFVGKQFLVIATKPTDKEQRTQ